MASGKSTSCSKDRASDPHDRRPFLDLRLEILGHPHRAVAEAETVAHQAKLAEVCARCRFLAVWRNRHQPGEADTLDLRDSARERLDVGRLRSGLLRLT